MRGIAAAGEKVSENESAFECLKQLLEVAEDAGMMLNIEKPLQKTLQKLNLKQFR